MDIPVPQDGNTPLEVWVLGFCKWLAAHPRARTKEQERVASEFAGTLIPWVEIRRIRAQKNFMGHYQRFRRAIESRLDQHRETFETENVGKAIAAHSQAIDWAVAEKDYRAIPALMDPAVKAMYKHTDEIREKPLIVLNLGNFAQSHLDDPVEDVEYEVLPPGEPSDDTK